MKTVTETETETETDTQRQRQTVAASPSAWLMAVSPSTIFTPVVQLLGPKTGPTDPPV